MEYKEFYEEVRKECAKAWEEYVKNYCNMTNTQKKNRGKNNED